MKFLPVLVLLPLLLATSPQAFAQTGGEQCAAITGDAERLICYDGVFRAPTSDGQSLSVSLESEQLIPARPSGRAPAIMTVSCDAGLLSIAFAFAGNNLSALGNDAGLTLQYDVQAARSRTLPVNADNTAVLINNSRDAMAFLDGLIGTTNLTARVTPVNSRSLSVRFRVDGFIEQVAPVRAACN
ncbi:hypothetical protein FF80_01373 [Devosia sp. LC5]|uniref:hypothetical protein n=1 Tax=Devosia sp. LC5 TaxID=1502724 RepID=UPI0004E3CAC7|nr:hypothetical protein [Devosia sp. LC5]KFC69565.1 hypothetical protein FF80_01373 [Devosia sp. LC5]